MPRFRISTLQWSIGALCMYMGALMLVIPHQFKLLGFEVLQRLLPILGTACVLVGLALVSHVVLALRPSLNGLIHSVGGLTLVGIALVFGYAGAWFEAVLILLPVLGLLIAFLLNRIQPVYTASPDSWTINLFPLFMALVSSIAGVLLLHSRMVGTDFVGFVSHPLHLYFGGAFLLLGLVSFALLAAKLYRFQTPGGRGEGLVSSFLTAGSQYLLGFLCVLFAGLALSLQQIWITAGYFALFGIILIVLPWLGKVVQLPAPSSVQGRLALLLAGTAVVPLVITTALITEREEALVRSQMLAELQRQASLISQDLNDYLQTYQVALHGLVQQPGFAEQTLEEQLVQIRVFSSLFPDLSNLALYDESGRLLGDSRTSLAAPPAAASVEGFKMFEEAKSLGSPSLEVIHLPENPYPVLWLGAPLQQDGEFAGLLTLEMSMLRLNSLIGRKDLYAPGYVYVVDEEGRVIVHPDANLATARADLSLLPPVESFLQSPDAGSLRYWRENDFILVGYARDSLTGWGIITERASAGDALAGVYAGREVAFFALVISFFLAAGIGILTSNRVTYRIRALSRAAEALSSGDFDAPVAGSRILELNNLASAFRKMRNDLADRIRALEQVEDALRQAKLELEERVVERTEELHLSNAALMTANQRLQAILDTAPAAIWIADETGKIAHKNAMVDIVWGDEAPLSDSIQEYKQYQGWWSESGEELAADEWALARALLGGEVSLGEQVDILRFDGKPATILNSAAPILNSEGQIAGAVAISQDITHQRQLEKQARQQAAEVEAIFGALADAIVVYDVAGKVIKANASAVKLLGFDPLHLTLEYIFRKITLLDESGGVVHEKDYPSFRALERETVTERRHLLINANNQRFHIQVSASPIYLHGEMTGAAVIWHDVTQREILLEENRRYSQLLESIFAIDPGGLAVMVGDELEYQMVNPAYRNLTPDPSLDPVGRCYDDVWPAVEGFQVKTLLKQVLQSGEGIHSARHKRVYPNGAVRYFSLHLSPITWKKRKALLMVLWETSSLEYAQLSAEKSAAEAQERAVQLGIERARLQAVLENAPAGMIMADADGSLSYINPAAKKMLGGRVTDDSYSPDGSYTFHHLNGSPVLPEELPIPKALAERKVIDDSELLVRLPDDREAILLVNATPVLTEKAELAGVVAVMQDITERRKREQQAHFMVSISDLLNTLQQPEELVASVVCRLGEFLRVEHCLLAEVIAARQLKPVPHNCPPNHSGEGRDWFARLPAEVWEELEAGEAVVISDAAQHPYLSKNFESEFAQSGVRSFMILPQARGAELPGFLLIASGQVREWSPEEQIFIGGVASRLWLANENAILLRDLVQSEERFRTSVENLLDGFAILSAVREPRADGLPGRIVDFRYEYVNSAACRLNRLTFEEQVGHLLLELLPQHRENYLFEEYTALVETGQPIIKDAVPYEDVYRGERLSRVFDMRAVKLGDGFVVTWRDVTERRVLQKKLENYAVQLEHSNQELEQFAFVASHDLQEPLRKVKVFSEILFERASARLEGEERDYMDRMLNAVERMQTMVRDLLSYSRVSTKGQPFAEVSLSRIAHEVASDLEIRISRSGGSLEIGKLPTLEADPMQMRQLIQNLLSNAFKFHREAEPPLVKIYTLPSKENGAVQFAVEDNGIGFEPQHTARIFQPFERLHGKSRYEGTGMGLAICHKIVERHHGDITADSKPGQGSIFVVTLPLRQP